MSVIPIDVKVREAREGVLRALLEAQNHHDIDASVACFAHPRYELVGNQRVYEGEAEVRRYYETSFGAFPDLAFSQIATYHSDAAAIVEMWMSGSHLGSRHDFEATGKHFKCRMLAVCQFEDAALVGVRIYYDTGTIARQLL